MTANRLELAKNRVNVYQKFLQTEFDVEANSEKLAFLDSGIAHSPYQRYISSYANFLTQKPDGSKVISYSNTVRAASQNPIVFNPYPQRGKLPEINCESLNFVHEDIKQACLCIGTFVEGTIQAYWLGINPLEKAQFWSATKIFPILNIICKVNSQDAYCDIDTCVIQDSDSENPQEFSFFDVAEDVVSYAEKIGTSNALSAMLKRFETRENLEKWVQEITGNQDLNFQGDYGETPFIENPKLFDLKKNRLLLEAVPNTPRGENLVTAYDITRLLSMLGWHYHLPQSSRLPGAQWHSLESVIRALGTDSARYVDVALEMLGVEQVMSSPVIISKLGHGLSTIRQSIETVYAVLLKFVDDRPKSQGKPAKLRTLALTLRGAKPVADIENFEQEALELDASIAAEVTEILRRILTEELP